MDLNIHQAKLKKTQINPSFSKHTIHPFKCVPSLTTRDKNEPSCSYYYDSFDHENNVFLNDVNEWKNKFNSLSFHFEIITTEKNNFEKEIFSLKDKIKELQNVVKFLKNDD